MENKVLWVLFLFILVNNSSVFAAPLVFRVTTFGWTDQAGNDWLHPNVNGSFCVAILTRAIELPAEL